MFKEKVGLGVLPKYKLQDYIIELIKEKHLGFILIYKLIKKELEVLKKYIKKNIAKKFIRKSKLLVGYSVLFALKKDRLLRLCINYRKLNNIIKKNRYPLPNI